MHYLQKWFPLKIQITVGVVCVSCDLAGICDTSLGLLSYVPVHDSAGGGGGDVCPST